VFLALGLAALMKEEPRDELTALFVRKGVGPKGDFNDVHVKHGLAEVARQIWSLQK
jgi:hypothetical protein